jgi:CubicO group peptidase (beta-lactamase class C family)
MRPAGWLHGSVLDLARSLELHLQDGANLLTQDTVLAMRSQEPTGYPSGSTVGYGQFSYNYRGVDYVSHGGSGAGFRSQWSIVPSRGFGVAIAANASWADPYQLVEEAFDQFLDFDPAWTPENVQTDPATWSDYQGVFEDPSYWGTVEVYLDDNAKLQLLMLDSGGTYRLYQAGRDEFFFVKDGSWYMVRFMRDEAGLVQWMVNRYWVGSRTDEEAPVPGPPPASTEEQARIWELWAADSQPTSGGPQMDD